MTFGTPLILLALIVVPVAVARYVRGERARRRRARAFADPRLLASVAPVRPGWRRHAPLVLYALVLAILVVAAARPRTTIAVPVENATIMLVTDVSGSMQATDVQPSRLDAARDAAKAFVDKVPDRLQVGVVAYRAVVDTVQKPTEDRDQVRRVLDGLVAEGGTATGDALIAALGQLEKVKGRNGRRAPAVIVLLSDGRTTEGTDPLEAAARARKLRIPIYTVALGAEGASIPSPSGFGRIPVPPDPETLRQIARVTRGQAYTVDEGGQLADVYRHLGSRLGSKREHHQVTAGFAGAGALLLAAALAFSLRWAGRLP